MAHVTRGRWNCGAVRFSSSATATDAYRLFGCAQSGWGDLAFAVGSLLGGGWCKEAVKGALGILAHPMSDDDWRVQSPPKRIVFRFHFLRRWARIPRGVERKSESLLEGKVEGCVWKTPSWFQLGGFLCSRHGCFKAKTAPNFRTKNPKLESNF